MDTLNKAQSLRDRVQASGITRVPVTIRPSQSRYDRYWILQIDRCPFCHRPHVHGGGNLDGPPALGPRLSHCSDRRPLDYELVPEEDEP